MAISIALAVVTLTGTATLPIVYVLAALGGVALAFDAPGRQSLTFQMVGPRELPNAVALNSGLFNGSRVIGPAIAGLLIAAVGTGLCFVLNAFSFLAVLAALALVRGDELRPVERDPSARIIDGLRRAFAFAWADPQLRLVLFVVTVVSLIGFNFHVLVPLLAADTLHVGPEGFGLLSASFGLGALVGALATATFREASWRLFAIGAGMFGVLALLLAPVQNAVLAGCSCSASGSRSRSSPRTRTRSSSSAAPDHLRGRLIAVYLFAFVGTAPAGGLLAGSLADLGGTSLAFTVAGVTSLVVDLRRERVEDPTDCPGPRVGDMDAYRTPDERFRELPGYMFEPHYVEQDGLRMHYVDEGKGAPVLMLHGEPTWAFLYRKMVPTVGERRSRRRARLLRLRPLGQAHPDRGLLVRLPLLVDRAASRTSSTFATSPSSCRTGAGRSGCGSPSSGPIASRGS